MISLKKLSVVILLVFAVSSCGSNGEKNQDSREFPIIAGVKFRKAGAINTDILWVGVKRQIGDHLFEPRFLPIYENEVAVRKVTEAFTNETKLTAREAAAEAEVDLKIFSFEGGTNKDSRTSKDSSGTYHVFKFLMYLTLLMN